MGTGNAETRQTVRRSLLWTLLGINLLVVGVAIGITALTVGRLADGIFASLMREFNIETEVMHRLFTSALARSLVLASVIAGGIGLLLSVVLVRRAVTPVRGMMTMAGRIADGDYGARVAPASPGELGSLAGSLNRMAEALATLDRLRKDLVANVAHELRTPLTNLRGNLEAIRDGVTLPSLAAITSLHDEVMRLVRLVDALHALSRFDARLPAFQRRPLDLRALVERLVLLRRVEFAERRITVRTSIGVHDLDADADLLAQALSNLLDNAAQYTPIGGDVLIATSAVDGEVQIAVSNSGEGIAPQDLPFIFERFYRGEKSRSRASGGAGIGLAIVKEVATAHGGRVGASSDRGQTTVLVLLPRKGA